MEQKHRLKKGQRIRLKGDGQDAVYELAQAGSEGWVKELTFDEVGFPMILVHWDTEHWTYNGEDDVITFEDHFEVVEEEEDSMGEKNTEGNEFLSWVLGQLGLDEDEARAEFEASQSEEESETELEKELNDFYDACRDGEAFIGLVLHREPVSEGVHKLSPELFQASHSSRGSLLSQMFLSQTSAQLHEALVTSVLRYTDEASVDIREDE